MMNSSVTSKKASMVKKENARRNCPDSRIREDVDFSRVGEVVNLRSGTCSVSTVVLY